MRSRLDDLQVRQPVAARLVAGDAAPNLVALDARGRSVSLADLWRRGPMVLTFLRHFGCLFCRHWLAQLEQHRSEFEGMGVNVVAVGLGEPKHAAFFGPQLAPSVVCLTRPTPEAHFAFGVGRAGAARLLQPGLVSAAAKAVAGGHLQGKATGDERVLSATFVVDRQGVIRYAHYARFPGDDPQIRDLLRAAQASPTEAHA